jgi:hypothetical protein
MSECTHENCKPLKARLCKCTHENCKPLKARLCECTHENCKPLKARLCECTHENCKPLKARLCECLHVGEKQTELVKKIAPWTLLRPRGVRHCERRCRGCRAPDRRALGVVSQSRSRVCSETAQLQGPLHTPWPSGCKKPCENQRWQQTRGLSIGLPCSSCQAPLPSRPSREERERS